MGKLRKSTRRSSISTSCSNLHQHLVREVNQGFACKMQQRVFASISFRYAVLGASRMLQEMISQLLADVGRMSSEPDPALYRNACSTSASLSFVPLSFRYEVLVAWEGTYK